MEALLPSEIARLVLGYLEDQKCTEAAKMFLETSPHLQECRTVLSFGRRFSTRVSGLTLMDIVEKFTAINTMIQERLNKVTDCEQLKHCGDLMEQLKFLVEEPRGQRFVVNINVPSQSNTQVSNGSPITASNMRKRRHSNSERIKRSIKSQSDTVQQIDSIRSPPSCHSIEATPLESLPGNADSLKLMESNTTTIENRDDNVVQETHSQCDFDKNITASNRSNSARRSLDVWSMQNYEMDNEDKRKEDNDTTKTVSLKRCTTATNTEELLSFCSAEVQTIPYDMPESESESNDEPIENLSILTKEILNRTELQECIAENINRAIIPTDLSLRDESLNESVGEGNTSIMAELNNAIKSIVEATETDPVFEKFLDEIIGPHTETDTSPEEDGEGKLSPKSLNETRERKTETVLSNISSPEPAIVDTRTIPIENETTDVPLKHRLRSSSRQQNNRIEDEVDKTRDQEKEQSALEDQNAAAVLSIINANITNNTSNDKKIINDAKESTVRNDNDVQKIQTISATVSKDNMAKSLTSTDIQKISNIAPSTNNTEPKVKKSGVKRPRPTKPKRDQTISNNQPRTEEEVMTTTTLVVCSQDEINNIKNQPSTIRSISTSRFIPIRPKESKKNIEETMYLKTVNVAHMIPVVRTLLVEEPNKLESQALLQSSKESAKESETLETVQADVTMPVNIDQQMLNSAESVQTDKTMGSESITLYGNESNARTSLDGTTVPTINLEENISLSESGLSPYLKFNCSKTNQNHNLSDIDLGPVIENTKNMTSNGTTAEQQSTISEKAECDIITKRTPKSLLKSRSKNSRLSLSTPRKRSTHIRALDFSTPKKMINSSRKASANETVQFSSASSAKRLKSVCRTSLFKSPPFSNSSAITVQKQKSPVKVFQPYNIKIPIATRSPVPKLMGDWDKYNGVGVIIGDVSPHRSTSASSSSEDRTQYKISKTPAESWDADLRKSVKLNKKEETEIDKPAKKKNKNGMILKKETFNQRSARNRNKRKISDANRESNQEMEDTNEPEEDSQRRVIVAKMEKNYCATIITDSRNNEEENIVKTVINNTDDLTTNKSDKISISVPDNINTGIREASIKMDNTNAFNNIVIEKKPVKKYAQLKTIRTSVKKLNNENKKNTENAHINPQESELSKIFSGNSTQHVSRMPDMIDLDTPKKKSNDISGPPPTPRMLSPSSNIITPFIKSSEDSNKLCGFVNTPEFPPTPSITLTPKLTEETTRDVKRSDYNSPYYKPTSEQTSPNNSDKISKSKSNNLGTQESPIISSSHVKLHSTHNILSPGSTYQSCTPSKLEITQFEVIKENLPKEEAIKELKIASSSKDSACAMELNAPVIVIDHVDHMIQINEFKDASKHCETTNDDHVDKNDSSSTSDISSSSDSSSSSSTSTTDSSTTSSSIEKQDTTVKNTNILEGRNAVTQNYVSANIPNDACSKKSDIPSIGETESSPKKVFAIAKTDDQIEATLKETPAKDETLLNEADISETPNSSKSGVENLTNLSTKISAMMTKNEKLSKLNKPPKKIVNKPRIMDIQCIRPASKTGQSVKPTGNKCHSKNEQDTSLYKTHIAQLEEKRQRIIAKIKDIQKSSGATHKGILSGKTSDKRKKGIPAFGRRQNVRPTAQYSYKTKINRDNKTNTVPENTLQENSAINTRKRRELQKQNSTKKNCDNEAELKKHTSSSKTTNLNLMNCGNNGNKELDDNATKQMHKNNTENKDSIENYNRENELYKNSLSANQRCLNEKSDGNEDMNERCSTKSNIAEGETEQILRSNTQTQILEKEVKLTEEQNILATDKTKQEMHDQTEDKANKVKQFACVDNAEKSKFVLKIKMDQVKRDLFSDEEKDQVTSCTAKNDKTKKVVNAETQNFDLVEVTSVNKNTDAENPKEDLAVLKCLQLVPVHDDENQTEKHQEHNERNKATDEADCKPMVIYNNKAEYHFVYDDSAPIRKRRRRYSAHELQFAIKHTDFFSDTNVVEFIKEVKVTEFEEIFNLPPKSKKRTLTKRTPQKNEKDCETYNSKTDNDQFLKNGATKPLASSSPLDEISGTKKKMIIKTAVANKANSDTQSDAKRKVKLDKPQEKVSDITVKSRKRKLSETKETKQIEKKLCTTDPQTLLSNVDLNEFLCAVHGPE